MTDKSDSFLIEVEECEINPDFSEEDFQFSPSSGSFVDDKILGTGYYVGIEPDEKLGNESLVNIKDATVDSNISAPEEEPSTSDSTNSNSSETITSKPALQNSPTNSVTRGNSHKNWIVIIVVGCIITAVIVSAIRRKGQVHGK